MKKRLFIIPFLAASLFLNAQNDSTKVSTSQKATATTTTQTTSTQSQASPPKPVVKLNEGTLIEQWDLMLNKSSSWDAYKVIKNQLINQYRKNLIDSLNKQDKIVADLNATIHLKESQLVQVEANKKTISEQLTQLKEEKDSVKLLGQLVSKSSYNSIMWSIVFTLLIACGIFLILFKRSNAITKETKESLTHTQEEFENHRKSALRREQKLARELHNEKNKFRS